MHKLEIKEEMIMLLFHGVHSEVKKKVERAWKKGIKASSVSSTVIKTTINDCHKNNSYRYTCIIIKIYKTSCLQQQKYANVFPPPIAHPHICRLSRYIDRKKLLKMKKRISCVRDGRKKSIRFTNWPHRYRSEWMLVVAVCLSR